MVVWVRLGQALSGADVAATLTTTGRHDGATGAGAHAGTETVLTRTTTVVGLESTLALGHGTHSFDISCRGCPAPVRSTAGRPGDRGCGQVVRRTRSGQGRPGPSIRSVTGVRVRDAGDRVQ